MNDRILISDNAHPVLQDILNQHGFTVDYQPDMTYEDFKSLIHEYQGCIINSKTPMHADQIEQAKKLKFIGRLGSGLDIIDVEKATEKGVVVLNAPEGNANAVAEHALGMLLALNNNLCRANYEVRNFQWKREQNRGRELEGCSVGIIGYGNNGSAFSTKLSGLNVKVYAYDKYKQRYATNERYVVETDQKGVLENADILSLHIPLSEETRFMVDEHFLNSCKPGIILINTSRGKIVKTKDLIKALKTGQIGGACLDVLENEDVSTYGSYERNLYNRLFEFDNVIISPHIAGWTKESLEKIATVLAGKILKLYGLE